ncbi:hypothetical protein HDU96_009480 [Phlyctochytrium bullatum]|nr:hypothetical protein HDU96_009480 [Phlyctochytrium bullatum]
MPSSATPLTAGSPSRSGQSDLHHLSSTTIDSQLHDQPSKRSSFFRLRRASFGGGFLRKEQPDDANGKEGRRRRGFKHNDTATDQKDEGHAVNPDDIGCTVSGSPNRKGNRARSLEESRPEDSPPSDSDSQVVPTTTDDATTTAVPSTRSSVFMKKPRAATRRPSRQLLVSIPTAETPDSSNTDVAAGAAAPSRRSSLHFFRRAFGPRTAPHDRPASQQRLPDVDPAGSSAYEDDNGFLMPPVAANTKLVLVPTTDPTGIHSSSSTASAAPTKSSRRRDSHIPRKKSFGALDRSASASPALKRSFPGFSRTPSQQQLPPAGDASKVWSAGLVWSEMVQRGEGGSAAGLSTTTTPGVPLDRDPALAPGPTDVETESPPRPRTSPVRASPSSLSLDAGFDKLQRTHNGSSPVPAPAHPTPQPVPMTTTTSTSGPGFSSRNRSSSGRRLRASSRGSASSRSSASGLSSHGTLVLNAPGTATPPPPVPPVPASSGGGSSSRRRSFQPTQAAVMQLFSGKPQHPAAAAAAPRAKGHLPDFDEMLAKEDATIRVSLTPSDLGRVMAVARVDEEGRQGDSDSAEAAEEDEAAREEDGDEAWVDALPDDGGDGEDQPRRSASAASSSAESSNPATLTRSDTSGAASSSSACGSLTIMADEGEGGAAEVVPQTMPKSLKASLASAPPVPRIPDMYAGRATGKK